MFSSVGLFKGVTCPEGMSCSLLNCMFAHSDKENAGKNEAEWANRAYTTVAEVNEEPASKKRRLDPEIFNTSKALTKTTNNLDKANNDVPSPSTPVSGKKESLKGEQNLKSLSNPISPPFTPKDTAENQSQKTRPPEAKWNSENSLLPLTQFREVKREALNPRQLSKPPASHPIRMSILTRLHEEMVRLNSQLLALNEQSKRALILSKDELVSRALDEEMKTAMESPSIYSNVIKLRITKLKKMTLSEWEQDVLNFLRPQHAQARKDPEQTILTGLDTEGEIAMLSRFVAAPEMQVKAGYVVQPPSEEDILAAVGGSIAAKGWEQCDRCNGRFQVFPGRREDGLLASGGPCTYHHARLVRPPKKKTDRIVGQTEPYFPCCNETVGTSAGCTKAESHVYKVTDVKRLASILQFERTPRQSHGHVLPPVCFDCEMGYTTLGMELIRLTAITWPDGKKLLDVLVRPLGEILDFNSRYSGVRPEHFANAVPYGSDTSGSQGKNKSASDTLVLPIVESPAIARSLLFKHLQPETPVIGHAIDNDLNSCRIIHPTIIDTIFLYPHPGGLPYRFGLRTLAKKYLERHIQTGGGDKGHDSMEDARATGDLVRVKVRETWTRLKPLGWTVKNGKLIEPKSDRSNVKPLIAGTGTLGTGAGTKRAYLD